MTPCAPRTTPRYAGAEPWQPGIPDLTMNL